MSYAGDVTSSEAYEALRSDPDAVLVDCRTSVEWERIGVPQLPDLPQQPVLVEWQAATGLPNQRFLEELTAEGVDSDAPVYFLCRSGARSQAAAIVATAAGFANAYNVADGFEGPPDARGRRGTVGGWQAAGLPWAVNGERQ